MLLGWLNNYRIWGTMGVGGHNRLQVHETFHYHLFVPIWIEDLRGLGSVYQKIFWARPISNFSISRPKGREIEIGDQSLAQKIFRYTDPKPLRSTHYFTLKRPGIFWTKFGKFQPKCDRRAFAHIHERRTVQGRWPLFSFHSAFP